MCFIVLFVLIMFSFINKSIGDVGWNGGLGSPQHVINFDTIFLNYFSLARILER